MLKSRGESLTILIDSGNVFVAACHGNPCYRFESRPVKNLNGRHFAAGNRRFTIDPITSTGVPLFLVVRRKYLKIVHTSVQHAVHAPLSFNPLLHRVSPNNSFQSFDLSDFQLTTGDMYSPCCYSRNTGFTRQTLGPGSTGSQECCTVFIIYLFVTRNPIISVAVSFWQLDCRGRQGNRHSRF